MEIKYEFKPTEKVYGIDPIKLRTLSYPDALRKKLKGVMSRLEEIHKESQIISNEIVNLAKTGNYKKNEMLELHDKYTEIMKEYKSARKAAELVILQLEEIGLRV